jgi:PQQ-dependent catabolism-associated CXXCW motif protein
MLFAAAAVAAAVGGLANADPSVPVPDGYRMDDYRTPTPDTVPGAAVIHTDELQKLLGDIFQLREGRGVVLIDVLPAPRRPSESKPGTPWMPEPHHDLPGSVWLPEVGRGAISEARDAWLRERLHQLSFGDPRRPIVFYCLKDCWMSWNAAKRAATYGYERVYWYSDGTDGWEAAGLPLAAATAETPPD